MNWRPMDTEGLIVGVFVGGLCGWNLLGAYLDSVIGLRSGSVSRRKSPELFWFGTGVIALVFGVIGVGMFLIGLGAPPIPAFALGIVIAIAALVAIARATPG